MCVLQEKPPMKRTIDDIDGNPVEIEIEDFPPIAPLDEMIQRVGLRDMIGLIFLWLGTSIALIGTSLIKNKRLQDKLLDIFKKHREKQIKESAT